MATREEERRAGGLWMRRVGALLVDWGASYVIAFALAGWVSGSPALWVLVVFVVEQIVLVGTLGHALGHRLFGVHVQRQGGGDAGPVAAAIRTLLIIVVLPAVVTDEHGRGLHDRAAGTEVVRHADRIGRF